MAACTSGGLVITELAPGLHAHRSHLGIAALKRASGATVYAHWPELGGGWRSFNLNVPQHSASLRRMAALDASIVGVGHGDPITENAVDRVHELAEEAPPSGRY